MSGANRARKPDRSIYHEESRDGGPHTLYVSNELITAAIRRAFATLDAKWNVIFDPHNAIESLFREVFAQLLPPPDVNKKLYDPQREIASLSNAALEYFQKAEYTIYWSALS